MLTFNLKTKYYMQTKDGKKTHEYRPANDYWGARIRKLKPNDKIQFKLGYTFENVIARVISINSVHINQIPICYDLINIYGENQRYYFDIEYEV